MAITLPDYVLIFNDFKKIMMNDLQKKLERWKIEREVDEHNESYSFREGYVKAMCDAINAVKNLNIGSVVVSELQAASDEGTPIIDEDGSTICNCIEPKQSSFPDGRYYCLNCWGEWYH